MRWTLVEYQTRRPKEWFSSTAGRSALSTTARTSPDARSAPRQLQRIIEPLQPLLADPRPKSFRGARVKILNGAVEMPDVTDGGDSTAYGRAPHDAKQREH